MYNLCSVLIALATISKLPTEVFSNSYTKHFEYKYSFKPPNIAQPNGSVPFWERFGNAIASADNIRVTPSLRSQIGSIWTTNTTDFEWWEVELSFRVSGRGRIGADGLAFWYVEDKGGQGKDSSVFGGPDLWKGLGIFFDSFDNDNQHNNPYIMAMVNDGTIQYDHQSDGGTQRLAGCIKDYRNKPFPLRAKIQLYNNILTMYFNNGMSKGDSDAEYELCFQSHNLNLTKYGYFGISAATGGLADDHDIQKFLTWSLQIPLQFTPEQPNPDQIKYDKQYHEYQEKHDRQTEEYKKEHPEASSSMGNSTKGQTSESGGDDEYLYDEEYDKEFKAILEDQSSLKVYVQGLMKKLDEIFGKHESIALGINVYHNALGSQNVQPLAQTPEQPSNNLPVVANVIERYEVENILSSNKELLNLNKEIRELLKVMESLQNGTQELEKVPPAEFPGVPSADPTKIIDEANNGIGQLRREVNGILSSSYFQQMKEPDQNQPPVCPSISCVSTKAYVSFSLISTGILIGYLIYKDNSQTPVKKFY